MLRTNESFQREIKKIQAKHQIPGLHIGMNQSGKRIYDQSFGYKNTELKLKSNADTIFGIASMTKSITCSAVLKLQEEGKLSVHDSITTYLPDFKFPNPDYLKKITVHHLMTHTSGMPPLSSHKYARKRSVDADPSSKDYGLDLVSDDHPAIDTYEELIDYLSKLDYKPLGEPGSQFSYSNDAYGLLGIIITRASGMAYETYVKKKILTPLQMDNSFYSLKHLKDQDNITTLYAKRKGNGEEVYPAPLWWDAPALRATGYLKSTINDILNFLEMIRNRGKFNTTQVLSGDSVKELIKPHIQVEKNRYYGYGLSIIPNYFGSTLIEHGGGLKGVSSFMCIDEKAEMSGVVLTNLSSVPAETILKGAINLLGERPFYELPTKYTLSREEVSLAEYEGMFISEEGMKLECKVEGEKLVLIDHVSKDKTSLSFVTKDLFITNKQKELSFIRNESGRIIRLYNGSRQIYKDS